MFCVRCLKKENVQNLYMLSSAPSKILPQLFCGDETSAKDKSFLLKHNIHKIVVAGRNLSLYHKEDQRFHYYSIPIADDESEDISQYFSPVIDFIDKTNNESKKNDCSTLVHCRMGESRSGAFIVAYLMKTLNMNAEEALEFAQKQRPVIQPNDGFWKQLQEFGSSIKKL